MCIRRAGEGDLSRVAEIYVFNNRIQFYPIFGDAGYSFGELQVLPLANGYFGKAEILAELSVFDDGLVKGFVEMAGTEIRKLYVDPFFQSEGVGSRLLDYAVRSFGADALWALEKNGRAVSFYKRNGFHETGQKTLEEGTAEYLVKLVR